MAHLANVPQSSRQESPFQVEAEEIAPLWGILSLPKKVSKILNRNLLVVSYRILHKLLIQQHQRVIPAKFLREFRV